METENEKYKEAAEKQKLTGYLSLTKEDHNAIGSTPPNILMKNPGKTMAELMGDQEIRDYLKKQKDFLDELNKQLRNNDTSAISWINETQHSLDLARKYLSSIERLPEEFE